LLQLGFTLGLAFWEQLNAVDYGLAIFVFWLIERPALVIAALRWPAAAFLVGSAPFWVGIAAHGFGLVYTPGFVPFAERLAELATVRLPVVMGVVFPTDLSSWTAATWIVVPIQIAGLARLCSVAVSSASPGERRVARLLVLVATSVIGIY